MAGCVGTPTRATPRRPSARARGGPGGDDDSARLGSAVGDDEKGWLIRLPWRRCAASGEFFFLFFCCCKWRNGAMS